MNRKSRRAAKSVSPARHNAAALVTEAAAAFARGDRVGANMTASRAFAQPLLSIEACATLAQTLMALGRREDAVDALRTALSLQPRHVGVLNNLAFLLIGLGRGAEAAGFCRQAIAVNAAIPESHYNLGNALRGCGQGDEALTAYRQAAALRPDHAEA